LLRVFIKFNVATEWELLVEFAMMDDEDLGFVDNEDGDGEINFFVNVGHGICDLRYTIYAAQE
jgi:hypothetical protein